MSSRSPIRKRIFPQRTQHQIFKSKLSEIKPVRYQVEDACNFKPRHLRKVSKTPPNQNILMSCINYSKPSGRQFSEIEKQTEELRKFLHKSRIDMKSKSPCNFPRQKANSQIRQKKYQKIDTQNQSLNVEDSNINEIIRQTVRSQLRNLTTNHILDESQNINVPEPIQFDIQSIKKQKKTQQVAKKNSLSLIQQIRFQISNMLKSILS